MFQNLLPRRSQDRRIVVTPQSIGVTDPVVNGLIDSAAEVAKYDDSTAAVMQDPQKAEERRRANEQLRNASRAKFQAELTGVAETAFNGGFAAATDQEAHLATNSRSNVLYLVVLAVVLMPVLAMIMRLNPQTFGTYIAPVTGIAGTVVGYWFGTVDRRPDRGSGRASLP